MNTTVNQSERRLLLVGLAAFSAMAAMRSADPMLVELSHEFGRPVGEVSLVVSAFAISYGLLQLIYGPLGDRYGKMRVIALAAAGCALACVLAALSISFEMLVAARIFMGASAAGIVPLTMAWIGDTFDYAERQKTLSRLLSATVSGMIAGQWLGGLLTETVGWYAVFALLAALFAGVAWALWRSMGRLGEKAPVSADATAQSMAAMLKVSRVQRVLLTVTFEGMAMFGVLAFVPSILMQRYGLSTSTAGGVIALYGVGGFIYSRFAGRLLQLLGERGLALGGGILAAAALLTLVWAPHWLATLPACLAAGAGFYMLHNTLQTHATQMAPERRGMAVAWFACLLFIGQSVGISIMGFAVSLDLTTPAILGSAAILAVLGALVAAGLTAERPFRPA